MGLIKGSTPKPPYGARQQERLPFYGEEMRIMKPDMLLDRGPKTRKAHLFMVALLFALAASAPVAAEEEAGRRLGVTIELDIASQYVDHGADVFDGEAAYFPAATLDLFQTGFYVTVDGALSFANTGELNDSHEANYSISFERSFFEGTWHAVDASLLWGVMTCPCLDREGNDVSECELSVAVPELIPLGPSYLVPSYTVTWDTLFHGDEYFVFQAVGLSYELPIPAFVPGNEEQVVAVAAKAEHWSTNCEDVDERWAHVTFSLELPFAVAGIDITPYVAYQISTEDTINDEDEFYGGVAFSKSF
jgi:hypothetical protein